MNNCGALVPAGKAAFFVRDVGEIDGRPYMAMEFLNGEPFIVPMSRSSPLSLYGVRTARPRSAQSGKSPAGSEGGAGCPYHDPCHSR